VALGGELLGDGDVVGGSQGAVGAW
jgi:hypothetical protein